MKDYAVEFYKSKAWKDCRAAYAKQAGGLCERCKANGIIKPGEIVHHKKHITQRNIHNENITLNFDNLELLCRDCHAKAHKRGYTECRYYVDQETGKIITLPDNF